MNLIDFLRNKFFDYNTNTLRTCLLNVLRFNFKIEQQMDSVFCFIVNLLFNLSLLFDIVECVPKF